MAAETATLGGRSPGALTTGRDSWQWRSWTRWPFTGAAVLVAAVAVVVDVGTARADVSLGHLGRVPISPALPLGLLLAGMIGLRRLGLDRANRRAWREFLVVGGAALVYAFCAYATKGGGWDESTGIVIGALGEELIYRLAVIVVVGAACAFALGRDWRNASEWGVGPGLCALVAGSLVFTFLPGHVAQVSDALHALPFAALGLVLGYAVLRTGALVPATIAHALLNFATVATLTGEAALLWRNSLSATALVALIAGTVVAGLRLGILRRQPRVVDLTAAGPGDGGAATAASTSRAASISSNTDRREHRS
jgi:membrane protease YdiL (CAAX protease family)